MEGKIMTIAIVIVILIAVLVGIIFIMAAVYKSTAQKLEKQKIEFQEELKRQGERIEIYKQASVQMEKAKKAQGDHQNRIQEIKADTIQDLKKIGGSTDEEIEAILNSMDDYNNSKL
jgi:predicted Holliday junction resolvase-like endonuclease